jgi:hypothetical protein
MDMWGPQFAKAAMAHEASMHYEFVNLPKVTRRSDRPPSREAAITIEVPH